MRIGVVAVALGAALSWGASAEAQDAPSQALGHFMGPPSSALVVPSSSAVRSQDQGLSAHTNTQFFAPKIIAQISAASGQSTVSPLVGPPFTGYGYETPASLACLYGLVTATAGCNPNTVRTVPTTRGSRAIAIVDAYHYPTALSDLQRFSTQFGLPAPTLVVKYATAAGGCNGTRPAVDYGWEGEEAIDIQMAHAMAPRAKIYLVEAQTSYYSDMRGAVACANTLLTAAGGGEVSMSWGGSEFSGITSYESLFSANHVVYFASSGDSPGVSWPASSPKVVSVGGTSISRAIPSLNFQRYASWAEAGEGPSAYFARPAYQNGVAGITGTARVTPDISAVANPSTGVWVYDSNAYYGTGWFIYGGTSVAAPIVAGIANANGAFRLNSAAELTALYNAKKASATANFATTTVGYCGPYASYVPSANWNYCLGAGTIKSAATPLATPLEQTVLQ